MDDLDQILGRCRAGDALAWEALVRRFQGRVYGVAFHYLREREEAKDLTQEIFVKLYGSLDRFEGGAFLPWLLQLSRNAAIDRLRRIKARPPASDIPAEEATALRTDDPSPEESWIADGRKRLIHRALGRMSERNREMILLKEIQGLQLQEIAEMLKLPLGTVKSRSNRARVELARQVVELDPGYGT